MDLAARRRSPGTPRRGTLPNFLILGAVRCGTSSLAHYLRAHPEVYIPPEKEVHFFDRRFERGTAWYAGRFVGAGAERAIGDATATYLYDELATPRMARLLPEARLVAIIRNPVDRAYSHYWMRRARGREPRRFEEVVDEELSESVVADAGADPRVADSYLDRGMYLPQLRRVTEHYSRESMHVVVFERLRDAPLETFREICRFLEVDAEFVPPKLGVAMNPFAAFRSTSLRRLTRRAPKVVRRVVGLVNTRGAAYPPMDLGVRARLLRHFADPNAELAAWLGVDLPGWDR